MIMVQNLRYNIVGIDSVLLVIDSLSGEIIFVNSPDYGTPEDNRGDNIYNMSVVTCLFHWIKRYK